MSRGKLRFKQRDLARAIRAAAKSGVPTKRVEIDQDGKIIVILGSQQQREQEGANEWDNTV